MKAGVLLTVPHNLCQSGTYCDIISSQLAYKILGFLSKYPIEVVVETYSNEELPVDITNSKYRNNTTYRKKIVNRAKDMKRKYGEHFLHLDIHSFNYKENPDWRDFSVVILNKEKRDNLAATGLMYYLHNRGAPVHMSENSLNDIHNQIQDLGIHSIILDINDILSVEQIVIFAQLITTWMISPRQSVKVKGSDRNVAMGAGIGLASGALLGAAVAGPVGLVVGSGLGAIGGTLIGKSIH